MILNTNTVITMISSYRKFTNTVVNWALPSSEKRNENAYVNGIILIGNASRIIQMFTYPVSNM